VLALVSLGLVGGGQASVAQAQQQAPAVVTHVVDGDTLDARLQDGRTIRVRLIGIDTPETKEPGTPVECGGPEAAESLKRLVEGRDVVLTNDASQGFVDGFGAEAAPGMWGPLAEPNQGAVVLRGASHLDQRAVG